MKKKGYRNCKSRRTIDQWYTKNGNVRDWILNKIFHGDKDELLKHIFENSNVVVYNGEVGTINCSFRTDFDMNGWNDEISPKRFQHLKAYFRKSRE